MAEFMWWLEDKVSVKKDTISEFEIDRVQLNCRKKYSLDKFNDLSFPTIAGVNSNGAIIHYRS